MESEQEKLLKAHNASTSEDRDTFELQGKRYLITPRRWAILLLVCCVMVLDTFSFTFFSFINDLTTVYFQVTPILVDFSATISVIGRAGSVLLVCLTGEWMTLKQIVVFGAILNGVAAVFTIIGVVTKTYGVVLFGSISSGCAFGILLPIGQVVSCNWFPANERGTSNAFTWVARRISSILANVISTRAIGVSYTAAELQQIVHNPDKVRDLDQRYRFAYAIVFAGLALTSLACAILSKLYVTDTPPLCGQGRTDSTNESTPLVAEKSSYSCRKELNDVKLLLFNKSYVLMTIVYTLCLSERPLGTILVTSLILAEFQNIGDQTVGIVYIVGVLLASFFGPIGGLILDRFSRPRLTFIITCAFSSLTIVTFSVCFFFHTIIGVFTSFLLLWSTRDIMLVCASHRLVAITSHLPPSMRVKAYSIPTIIISIWVLTNSTSMRLLMESYNSAVAVLFPLPSLLICILIYIFVWSYLRDPE